MLTKEDRIVISKKVIAIEKENEGIDSLMESIALHENKLIEQDNANKAIFNISNVLISQYESEVERLFGLGRVSVLEQDLINSSQMKLGNYFSPNDQSNKAPSLPDGVWKLFLPYAKNIAIGKNYQESFGVTQGENEIIGHIKGVIDSLEAFVNIERVTGQSCESNGVCSISSNTTQLTCVDGGGTWNVEDVISNNPQIHSLKDQLFDLVGQLRDFISLSKDLIVTNDSDSSRQTLNDLAILHSQTTLHNLNYWLSLPSFDTNHHQTTCVDFYMYNPFLLIETLLRADSLQDLKDILIDRENYLHSRDTQIQGFLGSVEQSLSDGSIVSSSGLYGQRYNVINLRLNLMTGSMRLVEGAKLGKGAQEQAIASNNNASNVYSSIMVVSAFKAPAQGHKKIHIMNTNGFSIGDEVFIASNTQNEISTTITNIQGTLVELNVNIPQKYRHNEGARLYKVL